MIIDPDFLDHWRTRMLVDLLGGDEFAPVYLIRLWAHCQTRKGDRFAMPAAGLKALCKFGGDAGLLESSMIEAGFVQRDFAEIYVPKWAEKNSALLAAWDNGKRGGRPKKETQLKPTDNPDETQTKPNHNPDETDKIRVDKIRGEIEATPLCLEPEKPASKPDLVFIEIQTVGKDSKPYQVLESHIAGFERYFPGVDVREQVRLCAAWNAANPTKRKTASGITRHLNTWLSKAQNDPRNHSRAQPQPMLSFAQIDEQSKAAANRAELERVRKLQAERMGGAR